MELATVLSMFATTKHPPQKNAVKKAEVPRAAIATGPEETENEPYEMTDILLGDDTNTTYADDWLLNRTPPR